MRILVIGATGFVGKHLYPALAASGSQVICASHNVERARNEFPTREWVHLDVEDAGSMGKALRGVDGVFYLVHSMGQGDGDYAEREARSAQNFRTEAERAGVKRVVYLGGVMPPRQRASKHLRSRARTGEILRSGAVSTRELRAAMIVGNGSISWTMVRDLAGRLPAMLLPRWLKNHSYPVAIDDVVYGLLAGLALDRADSAIFEIPGPERIAHRDILQRVSRLLGPPRPMVNIPVLSPRLSSYWIALVTRVEHSIARELVEGLRFDLDPAHEVLWNAMSHTPLSLEQGARLAIAGEDSDSLPDLEAEERLRALGRRFRGEKGCFTRAAP